MIVRPFLVALALLSPATAQYVVAPSWQTGKLMLFDGFDGAPLDVEYVDFVTITDLPHEVALVGDAWWVCDTFEGELELYDLEGSYLGTVDFLGTSHPELTAIATDGAHVWTLNGDDFLFPPQWGIRYDASGFTKELQVDLPVAEYSDVLVFEGDLLFLEDDGRIDRFDTSFNFLGRFDDPGAPAKLGRPRQALVRANGNVLVAGTDLVNCAARVWEYDPSGQQVGVWAVGGCDFDDLLEGLAELGDGRLLLVNNRDVIAFDPTTSQSEILLADVYASALASPFAPPSVGASYCGPANLNSTGLSAEIGARGVASSATNVLVLEARALPPNRFGYFLTSDVQDFVAFAGGSQGNLCLGGNIGRYAKDVASSGPAGELALVVDLTALPTNPPRAVMSGETWNFQAWFRDVNPNPTSNFTDGVAITFQ